MRSLFLLPVLATTLFAVTPGGRLSDTALSLERRGYVNIQKADPSIFVSLMYSRADNFTGEVLYTFQEAADYSGSTVFLEGNHVIILSQPNEEAIPRRASVWEKDSDGQFEKTIDADISQATFSDCRSIRALYDEVQNRLLIAAFQNTYVSPSLQVAVCQEKAMTYAATFISSQDKLRKTTFFQAADEFPRLHLIQTQ